MRKRGARGPKSRMNRAIAGPSSSTVVSLEAACHAGGRGFESRRSRLIVCAANEDVVLPGRASSAQRGQQNGQHCLEPTKRNPCESPVLWEPPVRPCNAVCRDNTTT